MEKIQKNIIKYFQEKTGSNLISIYAIGSYLTDDFIEGYSDIDLAVFVKNNVNLPHSETIQTLSEKNGIKIGASYIAYDDFLNRIQDNAKATRFFSNIFALQMKNGKATLLYGKDLASMLPKNEVFLARNLQSELLNNYFHAKSPEKEKNVFVKEPMNFLGYILNMSNDLLVAKGVFSNKTNLVENIKKYYPSFGSIRAIEKALELRKKRRINFNQKEADDVKKMLSDFLDDYSLIVTQGNKN